MSTAAYLFETLRSQGIAIRRDGDLLKLKAASGNVPADVIELARALKPELLAALPDPIEQRRRLLLAAQREGIPRDVIDELDDADLEGVEHWTDVQLRTAVRWYRGDPPSLWRAPFSSGDNRESTP